MEGIEGNGAGATTNSPKFDLYIFFYLFYLMLSERQNYQYQLYNVLGMTRLEIDPINSRSEGGISTNKAICTGDGPLLSVYAPGTISHSVTHSFLILLSYCLIYTN